MSANGPSVLSSLFIRLESGKQQQQPLMHSLPITWPQVLYVVDVYSNFQDLEGRGLSI